MASPHQGKGKQTPKCFDFSWKSGRDYPEERRVLLLRGSPEALTNVKRHLLTRHVACEFTKLGDALYVTIHERAWSAVRQIASRWGLSTATQTGVPALQHHQVAARIFSQHRQVAS